MLGHVVYSEDNQRKIVESDIFHILKSEGVTEIGALYKVSLLKFVLIFGSKIAKEKHQGTKIQYHLLQFPMIQFASISSNELVLSEISL